MRVRAGLSKSAAETVESVCGFGVEVALILIPSDEDEGELSALAHPFPLCLEHVAMPGGPEDLAHEEIRGNALVELVRRAFGWVRESSGERMISWHDLA